MDSFLGAVQQYAAPFGIAATSAAVVWGVVEYLFAWAGDSVRRWVAFATGQAVLFWIHWADVYSFGAGPKGWALANLMGLAAAPLAAAFHDKVIAQYAPWAKAENVAAKVTALVKAGPPAGGQP